MQLVYASNVIIISVKFVIKMVHDKKKSNNHKKENIDPFIPIELKCPIHPQNPLNLYCADENDK